MFVGLEKTGYSEIKLKIRKLVVTRNNTNQGHVLRIHIILIWIRFLGSLS